MSMVGLVAVYLRGLSIVPISLLAFVLFSIVVDSPSIGLCL